MQGKMFVRNPKGYHTEVIGDRGGETHRIVVPNKAPVVAKAKAFRVFCEGGKDAEGNPNVEVYFDIDGADAVTTGTAITKATGMYRTVMDLATSVHVKAHIEPLGKVGQSLPSKGKVKA